MLNVQIEGIDELQRKLENLNDEIKKTIVQRALVGGAEYTIGEIKKNIRDNKLIDTSNLFNSIQIKDVRDAYVTFGSLNVIYNAIHEYGGTIYPKKAKMLSWIDRNTGERIFANKVTIPARPYIRPAIDTKKDKIVDVIAGLLDMMIEEATR